MTNLDFDSHVVLACVHTTDAPDHLRKDDHVAQVGPDCLGLLDDAVNFHTRLFRLPQLGKVFHVLRLEASSLLLAVEPTD